MAREAADNSEEKQVSYDTRIQLLGKQAVTFGCEIGVHIRAVSYSSNGSISLAHPTGNVEGHLARKITVQLCQYYMLS